MSALTRFLGDTPLRVLLKLLVLSFLVGLVMNAFGWSPMDVLYGIRNVFIDLWNLGFRAIDRFLGYILLGAAIVIPAFILLRIANYRKVEHDPETEGRRSKKAVRRSLRPFRTGWHGARPEPPRQSNSRRR